MFYHLEGIVSDIDINFAVIDCGGVGYGVNTTVNTFSQLKIGHKSKLYISECIKEDAFELYGFATLSEKKCFELLLTVSGIGPKAAQSILSANSPEALAAAIINGDERAITVAQGIGKKIAQRVILELRDKISKETGTVAAYAPAAVSGGNNELKSEAVAALTMLGYTAAEINSALKNADLKGMSTEEVVRLALKNLV